MLCKPQQHSTKEKKNVCLYVMNQFVDACQRPDQANIRSKTLVKQRKEWLLC